MSSLRPRSLRNLLTFTRASVGTHCNAAGLLVSAAVNAPRVDYDPDTLAVRGLLIEESRINYLLRSQEISNATWAKARSSVTADAVTAPDGTITGDKVIEDTTVNDSHYVSQVYTKGSTTESQAYTASVWVKAGGRTQFRLSCQGTSGSANSAYALFDLSAGTVGTVTVAGAWDNADANIEAWANGWYRCRLHFRVDNDGQTQVQFVAFLASGGSVSYTGNGSSGVYLWGAQLEKGVQGTSYIATTTATVTRSADSCVTTALSPWFNERDGTLFAEYLIHWPDGGAADLSRRAVEIDDGTGNNRMLLYYSSSNRYSSITTLGTNQVSTNDGTYTSGVQRHAMAWAENDFASQANGGSVSTDSELVMPTDPTQMSLGSALGSSHLNGHLRKLKFYPRRLTNTELAALVA